MIWSDKEKRHRMVDARSVNCKYVRAPPLQVLPSMCFRSVKCNFEGFTKVLNDETKLRDKGSQAVNGDEGGRLVRWAGGCAKAVVVVISIFPLY